MKVAIASQGSGAMALRKSTLVGGPPTGGSGPLVGETSAMRRPLPRGAAIVMTTSLGPGFAGRTCASESGPVPSGSTYRSLATS